jgi:CcmD family protein
MTLLKSVIAVALLLGLAGEARPVATVAAASAHQAQPPAEPEQQEEFIPIDQLPPQDQLPAAPLLIGAYVFVLTALFAYLFSVARRLRSVQRELERLETDMKRGARG